MLVAVPQLRTVVGCVITAIVAALIEINTDAILSHEGVVVVFLRI